MHNTQLDKDIRFYSQHDRLITYNIKGCHKNENKKFPNRSQISICKDHRHKIDVSPELPPISIALLVTY